MHIYSNYSRGYTADCPRYYDDCDKKTLGELLEFCRKEANYSVEDVARFLRCKPKKVIDYEHNKKMISYKDLFLLSVVYMRSMNYFCRFFADEYLPKHLAAKALFKYSEYTDKYYNAEIYFPSEDELEAIWAVVDYATCPQRK